MVIGDRVAGGFCRRRRAPCPLDTRGLLPRPRPAAPSSKPLTYGLTPLRRVLVRRGPRVSLSRGAMTRVSKPSRPPALLSINSSHPSPVRPFAAFAAFACWHTYLATPTSNMNVFLLSALSIASAAAMLHLRGADLVRPEIGSHEARTYLKIS